MQTGGSIIENKIYITDLDDTLLNTEARISKKNAEKINVMIRNGLYISYITARDFISSKVIMKDVAINIPVAVSNGAAVVDLDSGRLRAYCLIKEQAVEQLIKIADEFALTPNMLVNHNQILKNCFVSVEQHIHKERYRKSLQAYPGLTMEIEKSSYIDKRNVISMSFVGMRENITHFYDYLRKHPLQEIMMHYFTDVTDENVGIVEIEPGESSKGIAAKRIANLVFPRKEVDIVAFGNGINDVSLLKCAKKSIAVGNVPVCLAKCADELIPYHNGESVVYYIENDFTGNRRRGGN